MKNLGINNQFKLIFSSIVIFLIFSSRVSFCQYYYINAYGAPGENNLAEIYVKSINLDTRSIQNFVALNNRGNIKSRKPAIVNLNNHTILLSISEFGEIGRNTLPTDGHKAFYTIIRGDNGNLTQLKSDSLENSQVDIFRQYQSEHGFRLGIYRNNDTSSILPMGIYDIRSNLIFNRLRPLISADEPGLIRNISSYDFLIKVPFDTSFNLYFTIYNDSQWWLVKLNAAHDEVIDSVQIRPYVGVNSVFAYNPLRNKFYCLLTNYELHSREIDSVYKSREDNYINPEVFIYDPQTLDIIERHPIPDYPDDNYPGYDDGLADVIGDFIVYYFFAEENTNYFLPAMLLIFDTRTNEATWLRVGWR